jgi:hypothetical protein
MFILSDRRLTDVRRSDSNRPRNRARKAYHKGIRVPVEIVLGALAGGMEIDEITEEVLNPES